MQKTTRAWIILIISAAVVPPDAGHYVRAEDSRRKIRATNQLWGNYYIIHLLAACSFFIRYCRNENTQLILHHVNCFHN